MNKLSQYLNQHLLGEVVTDATVRQRLSTDNSPLTIVPDIVAYPRATSDIRKLMRFSWQLAEKKHTLPITPRGSGTGTTGGALGAGVVVSLTSHMNRIFEFDMRQQLVRLQPGVNVRALKDALWLQGSFAPELEAANDESTVGGMIMGGAIDPALIHALEIVLADGEILQTGRISKRELAKRKAGKGLASEVYRALDALIDENVELIEKIPSSHGAGYPGIADVKRRDGSFDLAPLFIGSQGSLGVLSEAILKASPAPATKSMVVAAFADATDARDVLDALKKVDATSVAYIDGALVQRAEAQGKKYEFINEARKGGSIAALLVVELHDSVRTQAKKLKRVVRMLEKHGAAVTSTADSAESDLRALGSIVSLALQPTNATATAVPIVDGAYVPLERFEDFANAVAALAAKHSFELPLSGHPYEGIWHVRPHLNLKSVTGKQAVLKVIDEYARVVADHGGTLVAENGEGRLQAVSAYKYLDDDVKELYTKVKTIFDPHNILNTGVKQPAELVTVARMIRSSYNAENRDGLSRI